MRATQIARSAVSNWIATASTLVVSYFMAPFLVHRLGNVEYGIWVLALSTTSYLYFLDIGLRSSVVRFVSRAHSAGNHEEASRILSAVLWVRLQIAMFVLLLATGISIVFPKVFHLSEPAWASSRVALLVIGLTISLSMPMSAVGAVLSALNRYDLLSYSSLLQLVVRVSGIVLVLRYGKGIVAIALCELIASLLSNVLVLITTRNIYPELKIFLHVPSRDLLRQLWSYGSYSFLLLVSMQLIYQADNVIVGTCISTVAVTFYSIGNSLCRYTQQLFSAFTNTFISAASVYESSGSQAELRNLYVNGTRAIMFLCLPVLITLIIRAQSFISLWMGPQYSHPSGAVTTVLAIALTLSLFNSTASSIAIGIGKHKPVAIWAISEASSNILISVLLAPKLGLIGVAIGTLIPSLVVNLALWPPFIAKILQVGRSEVVYKIVVPVGICALPFTLACVMLNAYSHPKTMVSFVYQTVLALPTFYLVVLLLYRGRFKRDLVPWLKQAISQSR